MKDVEQSDFFIKGKERKKVKKGLIIVIDGPSAAGKSTLGKLLAREYHYTYIDTGAMYRALAWKAMQRCIPEDDECSLKKLLQEGEISLENTVTEGNLEIRVYWDGEEVTPFLRTPQVGMTASKISALPGIRLTMVDLQRKIGRHGAVVMDGRDIGTFVFPKADKKFFLEATPEERAGRRWRELMKQGVEVSYEEVLADLKKRDHNDRSRELAPLIKADDAIFIDSTNKTIEDVLILMKAEIGF
jgi:cytidylate kinase